MTLDGRVKQLPSQKNIGLQREIQRLVSYDHLDVVGAFEPVQHPQVLRGFQ